MTAWVEPIASTGTGEAARTSVVASAGIREARAAAWDDEIAGQCRLVEASAPTVLRQHHWRPHYLGTDGLGCWEKRAGRERGLAFVHSIAREADGNAWAHLSLSRRDHCLPTWDQARDTWRLIYPALYGVIVIPPASHHVDLAEVLHVWGNLSAPAVPDFTHGLGTI